MPTGLGSTGAAGAGLVIRRIVRGSCAASVPFQLVTKLVTAATAVLAGALLAVGYAGASTQEDVTILAADGTQLAATLFVPDGSPPSGGWPAVVFLHGLGGDRSSAIAIARAMGVVGDDYVVLAYDARGHGESGGLIGIDGPAEIGDARAVFEWLRDRPDVADAQDRRLGHLLRRRRGVELARRGCAVGGARAGDHLDRPRSRRSSPQGLVKTGVVAGFISSLDPAKVDPSVIAIRERRLRGRHRRASPRSRPPARPHPELRGVKTPVFMMQGRRDFAFGLDQVRVPVGARSPGPKRLWIGQHRPRAVLVPRGRHRDDARRGQAVVRPLPARDPQRHRRVEARRAWPRRARRACHRLATLPAHDEPAASRSDDGRHRTIAGERQGRPGDARRSRRRSRCSAHRPCRWTRARRAAGRASSRCSARARRPGRRSSSQVAVSRPRAVAHTVHDPPDRPGDLPAPWLAARR